MVTSAHNLIKSCASNMTMQLLSVSDSRFSSSRSFDEIPSAPTRRVPIENGDADDCDSSIASSLEGSDHIPSSARDWSDDDSFWMELMADEVANDDDDEFACLYGHVYSKSVEALDKDVPKMAESDASMSVEDASISDDDVSIGDDISIESYTSIDDDVSIDTIQDELDFRTVTKAQHETVNRGNSDAPPSRPIKTFDYEYGFGVPDSERRQQKAQPKLALRSAMKPPGGSSRHRRCLGGEIEVFLPCQEKSVSRRLSITFSEDKDINHIEKVTDMHGSKDELWFQPSEFKSMSQRAYREAIKAKKGDTSTDIRGLESLVHGEKTNKRVYKALDTVLGVQDVQFHNYRFDESQIADRYTLSAVDSKIDARMRARRDAREIEEYLKDTRDSMRSMRTILK